jgi:vacuolar-type H+-ATPase subunit I/STV1
VTLKTTLDRLDHWEHCQLKHDAGFTASGSVLKALLHDARRAHELLTQRDQLIADSCATDTAIRESCRKVLGDAALGDSVAVPPAEDLVERVVAERNRLAAVDSRLTTYEAIETAAEKFYGEDGYRWSHGEALMDLVEDAGKLRERVKQLEAELAKERSDG